MINTHLKVFDTEANYEAGKLNLDMPNVSYCEDTEKLKYLNSMADLYDVYGTIAGDETNGPSYKVNNSSWIDVTVVGENNFGCNINENNITKLVFTDEQYYGNSRIYITIDKLNVDTSKITDMSGSNSPFNSAKGLQTVNLDNFDTSSCTTMKQMFYMMSNLKTVDAHNFDVSKVDSFQRMFGFCGALTSVNLSNWSMKSTAVITEMFLNDTSLTTVTANNTDQTTFGLIGDALVSSRRTNVTIIRDGVSYIYQNGAWVAQ